MNKISKNNLLKKEVSSLENNISLIESVVKYLETGFNENLNYIHSDMLNLISLIDNLTQESKNKLEVLDNYYTKI